MNQSTIEIAYTAAGAMARWKVCQPVRVRFQRFSKPSLYEPASREPGIYEIGLQAGMNIVVYKTQICLY